MEPLNEIVDSLPNQPPPWNRPLAFLDCETSGLKASSCDIIDVAVIRDGLPWSTKLRITPWDEQRADNCARPNERRTWRDVTGYNRAEWADAPLPADVAPELARQLHGCVWVGHNMDGVDFPFLEAYFRKYGIPFRAVFCGASIDTYHLAKAFLGRLGLRKFALDACCEFIGLEREGLHRAMGGAVRCRQLFHYLAKTFWAGHATLETPQLF